MLLALILALVVLILAATVAGRAVLFYTLCAACVLGGMLVIDAQRPSNHPFSQKSAETK